MTFESTWSEHILSCCLKIWSIFSISFSLPIQFTFHKRVLWSTYTKMHLSVLENSELFKIRKHINSHLLINGPLMFRKYLVNENLSWKRGYILRLLKITTESAHCWLLVFFLEVSHRTYLKNLGVVCSKEYFYNMLF